MIGLLFGTFSTVMGALVNHALSARRESATRRGQMLRARYDEQRTAYEAFAAAMRDAAKGTGPPDDLGLRLRVFGKQASHRAVRVLVRVSRWKAKPAEGAKAAIADTQEATAWIEAFRQVLQQTEKLLGFPEPPDTEAIHKEMLQTELKRWDEVRAQLDAEAEARAAAEEKDSAE